MELTAGTGLTTIASMSLIAHGTLSGKGLKSAGSENAMLKDASARDLISDARAIHDEAMARLAAGDWRDAAEKAWCATRNATEAAVLEVYGVDNTKSTNIDAGIRFLAKERGGEWIVARNSYSDVVYHLHIEAFYRGVYHMDIPDLIRDVAVYIDLVEGLADGG